MFNLNALRVIRTDFRGIEMMGSRGVAAAVCGGLLLSSCASPEATKALGTLAGSSAGAAASTAINASGAWGYLVSIASTAVGGIAGNQVARLVGSGAAAKSQQSAMEVALNDTAVGKAHPYGASNENAVYATSGPFVTALGLTCRSYMVTSGQAPGGNMFTRLLGGQMPVDMNRFSAAGAMAMNAKDKAEASANQAQGAANAIGSNPLEAARSANAAAGSGQSAVNQAGEAGSALKSAFSAPVDKDGKPTTVRAETFGTACKDNKGVWTSMAAKG
jgi:hypothetical protein